jgi:hypothetical protein
MYVYGQIFVSSTVNCNDISCNGNINFNGNINGISNSYFSGLTSNIENRISNLQNLTSDMSHINTTTFFSNNVTISGLLNGISNSTYSFLSGISSNVQSQFNTINNNILPLTYSSGIFSVGGENNFYSNAISSPIRSNSISSGTSDGASYSAFNLAINSWYGVGFVDSYSKACNIFFDLRNGDINFKGNLNNISATTLNFLSSVTSNIQNQFNTLTSQITTLQNNATGISYNSANDYTDITNNVSVYGDLGFTGAINSIPKATFNYLSGAS